MTAMAEPAAGAGLADDPAVPTRDLLLDGDVVGRALAREAGLDGALEVERCVRVRAKYRAGESLRVVYRLTASGRDHWLVARSYTGARAERAVREGLTSAFPAGPLRAVTAVAELGVFYAFPNDRKLAGLPLLAGGPALELLTGHTGVQTELVAWAPEASATARCRAADGEVVAYAKVYNDDQARRTQATHEAFTLAGERAGADAPLVAGVLGCSPARGAIAIAPVPGPTLLALHGDARGRALERLGAALAALHGYDAPAGTPIFDRLDDERLTTAADVVARARPDVADAAHALARALHDRAPRGAATCCLHGDPHPGNVIAAGERVALVDLDHVALGPAAADLARILAGLTIERLGGWLDPATERELARRVLDGYAAVRPLPAADELAWHAAASLLARHALPAVSRVRERALEQLPATLAAAAELLA
jgi:Ser/Thr protein kinase RdoA (MazF antagonist)